MKIILSPAKKMNLSQDWDVPFCTQGQFLEKADVLNSTLKAMSIRELGILMKTSPSVSHLNKTRIEAWKKNISQEDGKPAILAFNGGVYRFLKATAFSNQDLEYAQDNIRILSGLYGLLRPLDLILPYRLEMGTLLRTAEAKNLHKYWKSTLTKAVAEWLDEGELLINLASQEYSKAIDFSSLPNPVITPFFKNRNADGKTFRVVGFWTKEARGSMTREVVSQRISDAEKLKELSPRDYQFSEEISSETDWLFIK